MSTVGIVGYGYVGKAVEYGFKSKHRVLVYDKFLPSLPLSQVVSAAEFIFICVPTPMTGNYRSIDLSIVESVFGEIVALSRKLNKAPFLVVKSTVIPGTTTRLSHNFAWPNTLFNPEFLTEANYLDDFINADRVIIGGSSSKTRRSLVKLYQTTFPEIKIFETDPTSAETVKYMTNTYLATKVIFANEMYDLCGKLGISYDEVKSMVVADQRIYDSHLNVTKERGFGQKCLPKDMVALLGLARKLKVDLSLLEAAWKKNLKIRKVRDWENIPGAVSRKKKAPSSVPPSILSGRPSSYTSVLEELS